MSTIEVIEPATARGDGRASRARAPRRSTPRSRAAKAAFPAWRAVDARRPRGAAARASPTRIEARAEDLATLEARNAGKPIGDARGEIGMVVETLPLLRRRARAPARATRSPSPAAST